MQLAALELGVGSCMVTLHRPEPARALLGFPEELWGVIGPLANCAWSVLGRRRSRWRLIEHNAGTLPEPVLSDDR